MVWAGNLLEMALFGKNGTFWAGEALFGLGRRFWAIFQGSGWGPGWGPGRRSGDGLGRPFQAIFQGSARPAFRVRKMGTFWLRSSPLGPGFRGGEFLGKSGTGTFSGLKNGTFSGGQKKRFFAHTVEK